MFKKRVISSILILGLLLAVLPMSIMAADRTPTLASELHKYSGERIVASANGDYAFPVGKYMTINTRMNGAASSSLPFFAAPSTATCNFLCDIPHLTRVYVYGVTAEKINSMYWAIIDYKGQFGFVIR